MHEKFYDPPFTVGNEGCRYANLPTDKEGWVDASKFYPLPYDMCELMTSSSIGKGWWSGLDWQGGRAFKLQKILRWKRIPVHNAI